MRKSHHGFAKNIVTIIFVALSLLWMYPIIMIFINSFKMDKYISTGTVFELPNVESYSGIGNYLEALTSQGFASALGFSVVITISSVFLILLCTSMCAWYITRVNCMLSRTCYGLFIFSMVVPFQMLMFTLASTADKLDLDTPFKICFIYLGFGSGLAVFMFTGFMKSIPLEIEEAALIDGCNPIQTFFAVVIPILKPTLISVCILETMWIWNDYLLPYLVLDRKKYMTIPILIQYFKGSYGHVAMGPMMASIMMTILPIIILYICLQKYIIKGVLAGAVKG